MTEDPRTHVPECTYERVMLAAREARRLNRQYLHGGIPPREKPTLEAIDRVEGGEVPFDYAATVEEALPAEERAGEVPDGH